jgi:hypothetical protein
VRVAIDRAAFHPDNTAGRRTDQVVGDGVNELPRDFERIVKRWPVCIAAQGAKRARHRHREHRKLGAAGGVQAGSPTGAIRSTTAVARGFERRNVSPFSNEPRETRPVREISSDRKTRSQQRLTSTSPHEREH